MATGAIGKLTQFVNSVVNLGAVISDSWFANVDANINSWISGTGPTLKALQIDGTGGAASTQTTGTIGVSGSLGGTSTPTPTVARGIVSLETVLFAGANYDGTIPAFHGGYNISSVTRSGAGVYVVNFVTAASDSGRLVCNATLISASNLIVNISSVSTSSITISVKNTSGVATDSLFHLSVFHV